MKEWDCQLTSSGETKRVQKKQTWNKRMYHTHPCTYTEIIQGTNNQNTWTRYAWKCPLNTNLCATGLNDQRPIIRMWSELCHHTCRGARQLMSWQTIGWWQPLYAVAHSIHTYLGGLVPKHPNTGYNCKQSNQLGDSMGMVIHKVDKQLHRNGGLTKIHMCLLPPRGFIVAGTLLKKNSIIGWCINSGWPAWLRILLKSLTNLPRLDKVRL